MADIIKIKINPQDLKPVIAKQTSSILSSNSGNTNRTETWLRLQSIGLSTTADESDVSATTDAHRFKYEFLSGQIVLKIRGNGIRDRIIKDVIEDRTIPTSYRELFKNEVYPSIKAFLPECKENFQLTLHYHDGSLVDVDLF